MAATSVTAVAHRGAPYTARENTLPAFRAAIAAGADAVELDVRRTRDGLPVVLHDRTLKRLWAHDGEVSALSAPRLHELTRGEVPTLVEALAVTSGVRTLIDLPERSAVHSVVRDVRAAAATDRVYYCGSPSALWDIRAAEPDAEIALSWQRTAPPRPSLLADLRPRWLNYRFGLLTPELVRDAHDRGYQVSAWTPDTGWSMRRLLAMSVDSLTTNRISTLRRLLDGPPRSRRRR